METQQSPPPTAASSTKLAIVVGVSVVIVTVIVVLIIIYKDDIVNLFTTSDETLDDVAPVKSTDPVSTDPVSTDPVSTDPVAAVRHEFSAEECAALRPMWDTMLYRALINSPVGRPYAEFQRVHIPGEKRCISLLGCRPSNGKDRIVWADFALDGKGPGLVNPETAPNIDASTFVTFGYEKVKDVDVTNPQVFFDKAEFMNNFFRGRGFTIRGNDIIAAELIVEPGYGAQTYILTVNNGDLKEPAAPENLVKYKYSFDNDTLTLAAD